MYGHGWNKFDINDTFMIDLFSVDQETTATDLIYRKTEEKITENMKSVIELLKLKEDEQNGKVKAKSVPLSINVFSFEFHILEMNKFKMKVKKFLNF